MNEILLVFKSSPFSEKFRDLVERKKLRLIYFLPGFIQNKINLEFGMKKSHY